MRRGPHLSAECEIELGAAPLVVVGFGKTGTIANAIAMSRTGIAIYSGTGRTQPVVIVSWEDLMERLLKT